MKKKKKSNRRMQRDNWVFWKLMQHSFYKNKSSKSLFKKRKKK